MQDEYTFNLDIQIRLSDIVSKQVEVENASSESLLLQGTVKLVIQPLLLKLFQVAATNSKTTRDDIDFKLKSEKESEDIMLPLVHNEKQMLFFFEERPIHLTIYQYRLLLHLFQNIGQICTRESCHVRVWEEVYSYNRNDNSKLDSLMARLRKKLRDVSPETDMIEVRRNFGYILRA